MTSIGGLVGELFSLDDVEAHIVNAEGHGKTESCDEKRSSFRDFQEVKGDLAGRSIRGGSSLVVSEIGCNIFRLLGIVVLARLLTPEHFGLIGMVTALTAFFEMFKDLGLGTATIQRQEITHDQISTLFWVNTGVGGAITLIFACASPLISWFYDDPRLFWVTMAISSTFLFSGLTVQHQALLRRQMRFARIAFVQVLSTAMSTIIGIILAWQGFEYWALVWKEVSRAVIQAGGTWSLSYWLPGIPKRGSGARAMFEIGSHVTGFNILAFASRSLDQVLLGKFWGPGPVGLYKQAGLLLMMPVSLFSYPITYVMTPALSALQSDPERYRSYYRGVVSFLAFGYMPFIVYIATYAESLIGLMLGEKWMASSPILQILALGTIVDPLAGTCGIVMITCGRTKDYFRVGVAQAVFLSVSISVGVNWGPTGVAAAVAAYLLLSLPLLVWFSFRDTPLAPGLFYEALRLPALATAVMGMLLIAIRHLVGVNSPVVDVGYSALLAPALYCGIWLLLPGGRQRLVEYFSQLRIAVDGIKSRVWSTASPAVSGS